VQAIDARIPGSNGALLDVVDRILRLTLHDQVIAILAPIDVEQLQHRSKEALETLSLTDAGHGGRGEGQVAAASPVLCSLAVECINVVERAELTTSVARLVSAGCEVLAGLLIPRLQNRDSSISAVEESHSFSWVDDTLEDLSDQLDFLALEVYCGLG